MLLLLIRLSKKPDNLVKQGKLIEAEEALKRAQEATENETKRLTGASRLSNSTCFSCL